MAQHRSPVWSSTVQIHNKTARPPIAWSPFLFATYYRIPCQHFPTYLQIALSPDLMPVDPVPSPSFDVAEPAGDDRTIEIMRADWQILCACTTG